MAHFRVTIVLFVLLIAQFSSSQTLLSSCVTNYTVSSTGVDPFRSNLLTLFADFRTSTSAFYNTTAGESPNEAYGLYLCRGDTTSDTCRSCVTSLTGSLSSIISVCKEGAGFLDDCMVHYANYSFFGTANDMILGAQVGKGMPSKDYNQTLDLVLQDVINDAASNTTRYATLEGTVNSSETVYTLAQCTPDINTTGCTGCLKTAQSYLQANITGTAKAAWALLPSCQLRYDNANFYGPVSPASPNSAPLSTTVLFATLTLFFVNWLI